MTDFFRVLQHLLPNGRAWKSTADKTLRKFLYGLSQIGPTLKTFIDDATWGELRPETTQSLDEWEVQFGLPDSGLTTAQRRSRLDASWKAQGGQSPSYIQTTLRSYGFDVYVHSWWEPVSEPALGVSGCATPRNPLLLLRRETGAVSGVDCGEALAACGEAFAECGEQIEPRGYPLVNRIYRTEPDYVVLAGEAIAECGEALAECGGFLEYITDFVPYTTPSDTSKWPYFLYIGAASIDDIATVPAGRRTEFESLCLKICPAHLWLGILVEYS